MEPKFVKAVTKRTRPAGFDQNDVWDIMAITAFFAMSNRIANVASIRPNPEFYAMGRNLS